MPETRRRCVCCTRRISRPSGLCWSCRYGRCELCRRHCLRCARPLTARCKTPQCYGCRNRDAAQGPRQDDRPAIHYYHARVLAGLPLFDARRNDRCTT
jgi:hypothetical protein